MYLATKWDTFNNTDDNSLDKDITDADSKKIIQHYFKLKKMHGKYMRRLWRMWGKRDIWRRSWSTRVRPCTMSRQGHSGSFESRNICLWGKSCLCEAFVVSSEINGLNWLKFVTKEFLSFVKTERFLHLLVRTPFFNEPSRNSAWAKTEVTSITYRQSCH